MKNKKMVLWIALIVIAIIPIYAQQYDSEKDFQIDWDNGGGVKITRYVGSKTEVRIPTRIQNNPVTAIGSNAFEGKRNITKITIPDSVTRIGNMAFFGCSNLTSINIPYKVTEIGGGAFAECTRLTSINLPNGITEIDGNTFGKCASLKSITIPEYVTEIGEYAFSECTSLTSVIIPNSVKNIGGRAFWGCKNLSSVTIPRSIEARFIGDEAFLKCDNLTTVIFQGRIQQPYYGSFSGDVFTQAANNGPGTYKRFAGGNTWRKESSDGAWDYGIVYVPEEESKTTTTTTTENGRTVTTTTKTLGTITVRSDGDKFPDGFIGTWKRDGSNVTLTFSSNKIKVSNETEERPLVRREGNACQIGLLFATIKLDNGNLHISDLPGLDGYWKKIN
jgi:hypothetical protein